MAEENENDKLQWVLSTFTKQAPPFEKIQDILEEKEIKITPRDYIEACKVNGLTPDIHPTYVKIAESTATVEDINLLLEDVTDSVKDRIQRKVRKNVTASHISHGGHQKLGGESMIGRTAPKRKRSGKTQSHGRGKHGHDRSTDKQRRSARHGSDADGT
jgi:hypothetical protein